MAVNKLKTDWQTIGRSGPTVDGREIKPEWITDAAKYYDPSVFAALIWPDHFHYIAYGKVEALRAVKNNDDGMDLQAIIAPNENYIYDNRNGRLLYFSMEITENFAKKGHAYLTGLAATDNPASLGTSEMRFSAQAAKSGGILLSTVLEAKAAPFTSDETDEQSFFKHCKNFFTQSKPEDKNMADKQALEQLTAAVTAIANDFKAFKAGTDADKTDKPKEEPTPADAKFAALITRLDALEAKFNAEPTPQKTAVDTEKLSKFEQDLHALAEKLTAALKEQPGTDGGADDGTGDDSKQYI